MAYELSKTSLKRLEGVHPDLVRVVKRAIATSPVDFTVLEGRRTVERQRELVKKGASKTMNSRHLTGHAVDLAPLNASKQVSWDWPLYYKLAPVIKAAAKTEGVALEWGGDWKSFKDGPHWQLPWKAYPANAPLPLNVRAEAPITGPTEKQSARTTAAVTSGAGATAGLAVAAPALSDVTATLIDQQDELASGDVARLLVAAAIVALVVGFAIWRYRQAGKP